MPNLYLVLSRWLKRLKTLTPVLYNNTNAMYMDVVPRSNYKDKQYEYLVDKISSEIIKINKGSLRLI